VGTLGRAWSLTKASWQVLMGDKALLAFTALAALCTLVAIAAFTVPVISLARDTADARVERPALREGEAGPRAEETRAVQAGGDEEEVNRDDPLWIVLGLAFYLVIALITIFFNTALVGAALARLRGQPAGLGTGFAIAVRNLPSVVVYALISATVGIVLAALEERFRVLGQIVASILGAAWGVVTFLVLPVMAAEGCNPFTAIKRSGALLKRTWGEQIVGSGGIGLVFFLIMLPGFIPAALGFASGDAGLLVTGIVVSAVYVAIVALIGTTLGQIYRAALYLYAETGTVPDAYDTTLIETAFKPRARRAGLLGA
jgi:hypothetical protein